MAAVGEWELVVKSSKKSKNSTVTNGKLSKTEKRQFIDAAPRLTISGITERKDVGKENRQPKSPKAVEQKKKKKPEKKKDEQKAPPRSLEEAIGRLSVGEMTNLMDVVVSRFKDSPLIWLKDLASYLNVRLNVSYHDPAFRGLPADYPMGILAHDVKQLLLNTLKPSPDAVLASFHHHCVNSMVHEQAKGLTVTGYKMFLQLLAAHRPSVCLTYLPQYMELRHSFQNQPPVCLSLLWALGQAGLEDFNIGLRVWLELMVPLIGLKNYSAYVVEYGCGVFSGGGGGDGCEDLLGVREFFSILDFTWCSSGSLPKPVQRQLFALYPKVKTSAFSASPETTLRNFFPSFLRRLDPSVPHHFTQELLNCLVQCLTTDMQCWSVWKQLYLKHLPQSALLLQHLSAEWSVLSRSLRLRNRLVREAVQSFANTNAQIHSKASVVSGVKEASQATQELLGRMHTRTGVSWLQVFTVSIMAVLSIAVWDISKTSAFKDSHIGKGLDRIGLLSYCEVLAAAIGSTLRHTYRWCGTHIPVLYSRGCELAGPYLQLVWEKSAVFAVALYTHIAALIDHLAQKLPALHAKIEEILPGVCEGIVHWTNIVYTAIQTHLVTAASFTSPYLTQLQHFLTTRVFIGPLAPEKLYEHLTYLLQLICQHFAGIQSYMTSLLNPEVKEEFENIPAHS